MHLNHQGTEENTGSVGSREASAEEAIEALAGEAAAQPVTPLHRRATSWPVTRADKAHNSQGVVVPGKDVLLPVASPFDAPLGSAESSWVSTVTVSPSLVPGLGLLHAPDTHRQIVASGDAQEMLNLFRTSRAHNTARTDNGQTWSSEMQATAIPWLSVTQCSFKVCSNGAIAILSAFFLAIPEVCSVATGQRPVVAAARHARDLQGQQRIQRSRQRLPQ